MTEAEKVAEGLSRAQRKAILNSKEIVCGEMNVDCSDDTWDELAGLGFMYWDNDALTPAGLSVRDILRAKEADR